MDATVKSHFITQKPKAPSKPLVLWRPTAKTGLVSDLRIQPLTILFQAFQNVHWPILRHIGRMLIPEMPIGLHREHATILMAEPFGDRWNGHSRFNAMGGEQMPQVVVGEMMQSKLLAPVLQRAVEFAHDADR